jgi:16S rRNA (cytosine1402-N4)-methyltransferase
MLGSIVHNQNYYHTPILVEELLNLFSISPNSVIIDCTTGEGGHSNIFASKLNSGQLISLDRDKDILDIAKKRLCTLNKNVIIKQSNFSNLSNVLDELNVNKADFIFYDLGISMYHYKKANRGFSFENSDSLDMRLDKEKDLTAYDIVNHFSQKDISNIIYHLGEEKKANIIAKKIITERTKSKIKSAKELDNIICSVINTRNTKLNPSTKTFQALRIFVNNEFSHIESGVIQGIRRLNIGGRIGVISFHSLEDRIIKNIFKHFSLSCICPDEVLKCECGGVATLKLLTKKPISPTNKEIINNPSARSAKLRVAEKVYEPQYELWQKSKDLYQKRKKLLFNKSYFINTTNN